ncbi:hypothetical protein GCM10010515_63900 [Streptomyces fructofermentans]|uniref:Uncharacterized protein n=1 Tax=Streptomyces fructofermentans TaxID=152141 RepID=A0A918U3V9_9ACTN|nr:hypothetical protein GCM10010515_63900 [Streptomyces fructofermentans]
MGTSQMRDGRVLEVSRAVLKDGKGRVRPERSAGVPAARSGRRCPARAVRSGRRSPAWAVRTCGDAAWTCGWCLARRAGGAGVPGVPEYRSPGRTGVPGAPGGGAEGAVPEREVPYGRRGFRYE